MWEGVFCFGELYLHFSSWQSSFCLQISIAIIFLIILSKTGYIFIISNFWKNVKIDRITMFHVTLISSVINILYFNCKITISCSQFSTKLFSSSRRLSLRKSFLFFLSKLYIYNVLFVRKIFGYWSQRSSRIWFHLVLSLLHRTMFIVLLYVGFNFNTH